MKYRYVVLLSIMTSIIGYIIVCLRDGVRHGLENFLIILPFIMGIMLLLNFVSEK